MFLVVDSAVQSPFGYMPPSCQAIIGPAGGDLLMGPEGRMLLQQVLQSSDAHVRMRGLHLLMSSAGQGQANLHALRTSGILPFVRPLHRPGAQALTGHVTIPTAAARFCLAPSLLRLRLAGLAGPCAGCYTSCCQCLCSRAMTRGAHAGLLQPLRAELSNTADVLSCSVALELVEELSQGGPSTARAVSQALSAELISLLAAPDVFLRCQAIRVRKSTCPLCS